MVKFTDAFSLLKNTMGPIITDIHTKLTTVTSSSGLISDSVIKEWAKKHYSIDMSGCEVAYPKQG